MQASGHSAEPTRSVLGFTAFCGKVTCHDYDYYQVGRWGPWSKKTPIILKGTSTSVCPIDIRLYNWQCIVLELNVQCRNCWHWPCTFKKKKPCLWAKCDRVQRYRTTRPLDRAASWQSNIKWADINRHSVQITAHALVADVPVWNIMDLDLNQGDTTTTQ